MPKKRKAANKKKMPMKPPPGMHDMGMESMMRDEGLAKKKPQPKRRK